MTNDILQRLKNSAPYGLSDHRLLIDAAAEVERLQLLCAGMADLLEDCRPADATISWVLRRLDLLEQWHGSEVTL